MFIQYLRYSYLIFVLFIISSASFADSYKWTDDEDQINYSQQPPIDHRHSVLVKDPAPPSIDPNEAQKEIDILIEKLDGTFEEKEEERRLAKEEAEKKEKREEYCRINQNNLEQYQNNPGRRMIDTDGNVIEPNEEQRQQKMIDIKQRLEKYCQ